jgi:exodeoxyribonuclease-5
VREKRSIPYGDWDHVRHIPRKDVDARSFVTSRILAGSQVLCGKNQTRRAINSDVRRGLSLTSSYPMEGESLVILRNDHELGVLNGVVCLAAQDAELDPDGDCCMISLDYEGQHLPYIALDRVPFDIYRDPSLEEDWSPALNRHLCQADWGYALTVHKAQGSEWRDVTLWDDGFGKTVGGNLRWKWLYTGITRASERLTIVSGERAKK